MREAFELYATGKYTKIQVLKIITEKGLKTKRGRELTPQTFDALLRKPHLCGLGVLVGCGYTSDGLTRPSRESRAIRHRAASVVWAKAVERAEAEAQPSVPVETLREVWCLWNAADWWNEQRQAEALRQLLVSEPRMQRRQGIEVHA